MERHRPPTKIDTIMHAIDSGLEEAERMGITDASTIHGEVWLQLDEGVQRGDYTMDEALGRYRAWHNQYALGTLAARGEAPANVIALPTTQPFNDGPEAA